jgi:signal transduction histidine kinase
MSNSISRQEIWANAAVSTLFVVGLILTSHYNYLLFHSLAELLSIVIAFGIFMFAWNTRRHMESTYFLFLGIAYLFVGTLDTLHTLSYGGMQIFSGDDDYATKLWLAARYVESLSLLAAFYFLPQGRRLNVGAALSSFTLVTGLLAASIFYWKIFPECFVAGEGLTQFKVISEYIISAILVGAIVLLHRNRERFNTNVFQLIQYALIATIIAELSFTFYVSNYGLSNLVGHIFKIISFKLIYEAIIATGLRAPQELLYRQLKQNEVELKKANAVKDRLFNIIAHDLKAPFTALIGLSEFLLQDFENTDDKEKKEFIGHMHKAATSTHMLLDNLLQWSLMQTDGIKLNPERLSLHKLTDENLALKQEDARQKGITLESSVTENMILNADRNMINAVIRNLLSNAIKYTHKGGTISMSAAPMGDFMEISISDTGTGMNDEEMAQLFDKGLNLSKPGTNQERGTGLGLMLCKEFIEKHGGTIRVESTPGEGSRFIFTLPKNGDRPHPSS